ncbi:MAG: hypothetical protein AAF597_00705 [Bacteroidota bacterium]
MDNRQRGRIGGVLVLFGILLVLIGCGDGDKRNIDEIIRQRVAERTAALTKNLLDDCEEDIMELAIQRADSLLIERARRMSRRAGRPPRPTRPGEPPVKVLSEPLPLRPLFPFEIRFDTLLRKRLYADSLRMDSTERGLLPDTTLLLNQ